MSDVVLNSSAVLTVLRNEPGADKVESYAGRAAISAVNLHEVIKEMLREGASLEATRGVLDELGIELHPHGEDDAYAGAALYEQTKRYGRGLGDRSCMALGLKLNVPVLTTDREWEKVQVEGLEIVRLR